MVHAIKVSAFTKCDESKTKQHNPAPTQGVSDHDFCCYLKSLLLASSPGEITQGRFWGRHSRTSGEKSEKSTPYSVRIPSDSGSISPACPRLLHNCLQKERDAFLKCVLTTVMLLLSLQRGCWALKYTLSPIHFSLSFGRGLSRNSQHTMTCVCWRCKILTRLFCVPHLKEMF